MYFDRCETSTHAVSKPIDILRNSTSNRQSNEYRNSASAEKQRPVNRVKPVVIKNPIEHTSISSNSSTSSVQPSQQTIINPAENKENCITRMPMIYNLYSANPSPSAFRTMPVDALTRTLYNYISVSPSCSSTDYYSEDEDLAVDDSDVLMPSEFGKMREFKSIGDIIGYANVIKSQRQQTMDRFNSTMSQFNNAWTTIRREMQSRREAQMQ